MKKTLIVSISLLISFAFPVAAGSFYDVQYAHPNYAAISYLSSYGRLNGFTDGSFRPYEEISRASFVAMLVTALNLYADESEYEKCYSDIKNKWYENEVCYAKEHDWLDDLDITGKRFHPTQKIGAGEALSITAKAFDTYRGNLNTMYTGSLRRGDAAQMIYEAMMNTHYAISYPSSYNNQYYYYPGTTNVNVPDGYLGPYDASSNYYTPPNYYSAPPTYYTPPSYYYTPPTYYTPPSYTPQGYVPPGYAAASYSSSGAQSQTQTASASVSGGTTGGATGNGTSSPAASSATTTASPQTAPAQTTAPQQTAAQPAATTSGTTTTLAFQPPRPVDPFTTPWTYDLGNTNPIPPTTPPNCSADTWACSGWATCSATGAQTRVCRMTFDCPNVNQPARPAETRSCTPPPICTSDIWSCTSWNTCSAPGTQTRTCTLTYDCPTAQPPRPAESQSCTPSTPPTGDRAVACAAAGIAGIPSRTPETYGVNYCAFDNAGASATQALIGQAYLPVVWGQPYDFTIPDSLWAMALAYSSDMFGINPNYLMGLAIKESHADCSYATGCFQIADGFLEVKSRFPLYIDPTDRQDVMVNSFGSASVVASLYMRFGEALWEGEDLDLQWSAFYTASADREARAKIVSRGYNRGLWDQNLQNILTTNRVQCMAAPDVFVCFPQGANDIALDHAQSVVRYCNSLMQSTNFYDTRLTWADIQRFMTQVPKATFSSTSGVDWAAADTRAANAFACLQDQNNTISFRYDFKSLLQSIKTLFPPVPEPYMCWDNDGALAPCP